MLDDLAQPTCVRRDDGYAAHDRVERDEPERLGPDGRDDDGPSLRHQGVELLLAAPADDIDRVTDPVAIGER